MLNHKTYPNVTLGKDSTIKDFCVIGEPPKNKKPGELKLIIGKNALIRPLTVIYAGSIIGDHFQTGTHVYIRENNKIGNNVTIGSGAKIEQGHVIGNSVSIHTACILGEYSIIEDGVWIGPNVIFYNDLHPPCPKYKECIGAPIIKRNVKIGARSSIFPGVIIGKNSIIGANSMVTKDIPNDSVAIGSPAKVVKKVDDLKCFKGFFKKPYEWEKCTKERR
ncbi:MAG: DapH/DapD/GlmU-related protein [Nanoarchaeota archaeon]